MANSNSPPPIRLMNFVSQDQLDEAKRNRGARVEDGTAQRDRSLYEVLKENKDKKDAEFNERFKHRPPKALDDDETEFLDKLELSRREYERQMADEEAQQLQSFQEEESTTLFFRYDYKVKPQAKKAKLDQGSSKESLEVVGTPNPDIGKHAGLIKTACSDGKESNVFGNSSLVSYSDESEDDYAHVKCNQGGIETIFDVYQCLVLPFLYDDSVLNHCDYIRSLDCGQPVGDHHRTSRALVASSSSSIFGLFTMARAIATLCFCPPDNCTPRSPTVKSGGVLQPQSS
ncbi:hypothetical protein RJ639_040337 [Escallonia herrerae]|uniref:FAM192A/Fyv6 N-terminal domain-containing protein n=1 Tax=Escallonia herrerae TaxID=1293975 RepID=A0AA88WFJ1_9ASTE|nr:hypothetical protein RJ639_040337 [Escallonia herrerae]